MLQQHANGHDTDDAILQGFIAERDEQAALARGVSGSLLSKLEHSAAGTTETKPETYADKVATYRGFVAGLRRDALRDDRQGIEARGLLKLAEETQSHLIAEYVEEVRPWLERRLAGHLSAIVLKQDRTRKEYLADYRKFQGWWRETLGADDFLYYEPATPPVSPELLAMYIVSEADDGASFKAISRAVTAIGYVHYLEQKPSPAGNSIVKAALRYAEKIGKAKQ